MYDNGQKFVYFKSVLKEVYTIIMANHNKSRKNTTDEDYDRLYQIIKAHLDLYNNKNKQLRFATEYDNYILTIYMSDYVIGRGHKKLFVDKILMKAYHRQSIIDGLLADIENGKKFDEF